MTDDVTTAPAQPKGGFAGFLANWAPTIVFNIAGPILVYNSLVNHGWSKSAALMLSALLPILEIAATYAIKRRIDDFGVFTLIILALTLLSFLAFDSARAILLKDAALTGVLGVGILGSLALSRPFAYYMGRKFATDGSQASRDWWENLWQYPNFRHTNRVITIVWGTVFLIDCAARVVLTFALSTTAMQSFNTVSLYVVIGATVFWTISYSNRRKKEAETRYGDSAVAPTGTP